MVYKFCHPLIKGGPMTPATLTLVMLCENQVSLYTLHLCPEKSWDMKCTYTVEAQVGHSQTVPMWSSWADSTAVSDIVVAIAEGGAGQGGIQNALEM